MLSGERKKSFTSWRSINSDGDGNQLIISVHPDDKLKFLVERRKQSSCNLNVFNNTEHCVAFKIKTTNPKKYIANPKSGVIQARHSCVIRLTQQVIVKYPLTGECKDKYLIQTTIVPPNYAADELPKDTFAKESGRRIEECKLPVVYIIPPDLGHQEHDIWSLLRDSVKDGKIPVTEPSPDRDLTVTLLQQ
ncbi:putative major sperm protein (MSP) [Rosa chinensis]|uniref:Putative major sperm protein (MSP) n=1 Tax=Rosa chinensis TaxID=74649 RepID=A0A2P6RRI4_ROSCH|nr:vesicle-associated protein 2-1 [Rosa chinensis]PRQ49017.1 putative major sperm protein (MSP) [Rosa chinensis]